jgi:NodT family efflux transporter outer membrane factor (OMF) lipoprotein
MKALFQLIIITIFLLSSCIKKEGNKHQDLEIKDIWSNDIRPRNNTMISFNNHHQQDWWKNFNSPAINKIVEIALENNLEYKISLERILEARADMYLSKSTLIPNFDISQSASSSNDFVSLGSKTVLFFNTALDASWEIDLFKTKEHTAHSKEHLLDSFTANQRQIAVTLVADLIVNYADYIKYKSLIDIKKKNIELHKHDIDIIISKHISGVANEFELEEKKAEYSKIKSEIHSLDTEMKNAKYRIETLCGLQAGDSNLFSDKITEIPLISKAIILNSPINVIQNRPDVQRSIHELLAATSMTKSAISEQYPKITLIGAMGYQDSSISPSSDAFTLGQSIASPILNWKRIRSNINIYKSKEEQAFLKYKKSMLLVIEDVESSLASYYNANYNYEELAKTLESRKRALELANHLYDSKTQPFTRVLNAEKDLLESQSDLIISASALSMATARLYKALGYGV